MLTADANCRTIRIYEAKIMSMSRNNRPVKYQKTVLKDNSLRLKHTNENIVIIFKWNYNSLSDVKHHWF